MRTTGKGTNGEFKCMMNYRRFNRDPATKFQRPYHAPNTPGDWESRYLNPTSALPAILTP